MILSRSAKVAQGSDIPQACGFLARCGVVAAAPSVKQSSTSLGEPRPVVVAARFVQEYKNLTNLPAFIPHSCCALMAFGTALQKGKDSAQQEQDPKVGCAIGGSALGLLHAHKYILC